MYNIVLIGLVMVKLLKPEYASHFVTQKNYMAHYKEKSKDLRT